MNDRVMAFGAELKDGLVTVCTHKGDTITSDKLFDILDFLSEVDTRYRVCWSADTFAAVIASMLSPDDLNAYVDDRRLVIGNKRYKLLFTHKSVFTVINGDRPLAYYADMSQFYEGYEEPDDLTVLAEMGEALVDIALHYHPTPPERLTSHAMVFGQVMKGKKQYLPHAKDTYTPDGATEPEYHCPPEVTAMAYNCTRKMWKQAFQIGHFEQTFDYDISSSFASVAKTLFDTRGGDWIQTDGDERPQGAVYGFLEGWVSVTSDLAPLLYKRTKLDKGLHITGKWWDCLPMQVLDLLREYNIGDMNVADAWWWVPKRNKTQRRPLYKMINTLYEARSETPLMNMFVKRLLVSSFYGKFIQKIPNARAKGGYAMGPYFFSPWAAIIEAEILCKVIRFILDNNLLSNLIAVAGDGVLLDKYVRVDPTNGLGKWRYMGASPALVVRTGVVFHGRKHPSGIDYDDAVRMVERHHDDREWSTPITCKVGLSRNLRDKKNLGKTVQRPMGFSLRFEHDRHFNSIPVCGVDLLEGVYKSRALTKNQATQREVIEDEHDTTDTG